ncbi:MAG: GNAT family N-acetyltransferase [Chloroflexota bacterium]
MNITCERATPADAEVLVKVQIAAFHDDARLYPGVELGGPPGYDSVEVMLKKIGDAEVYKIIADGQIVGDIILYDEGQGHFHLDVLAVDPAYHSRGIGTQAMQFIERTYPAQKWTLDTPGYALRNQHFYEKFGYVKVGENFEPDGLLLIAYEKQIG